MGDNTLDFFMLALLRRASFFDHHPWSIFQSSLHTLQVTFLHDIDILWAAFMYCISSCLSDLWLLSHGSCTSVFMLRIWSYCSFQSGPPKRLESYTIWPRLYVVPIQIGVRRKDSPLPGFKPGKLHMSHPPLYISYKNYFPPSQCATNWAIQAE